MSQSGFPIFIDQGGCLLHAFSIDGSAVTATSSADGLDGRGSMFCDISDAANIQTVVFKNAMVAAYVFLEPLTANGACTMAPTTNAGGAVTGFTLTGLERDDNTTGLADQSWNVVVMEFKTDIFVN
jgi:hypothetical protein